MGGLRDTITHLNAVHAQRPGVIKDQSIETKCAARRKRLLVEQLSVAIDIDFDLGGIRQKRGLSLLDRELGEKVVRRKGDGIDGKISVLRGAADDAVDGLREQGDRAGGGVDSPDRGHVEGRNIDILSRDHVREAESSGKWQLRKVVDFAGDLENTAGDTVIPSPRHLTLALQ